MNKKTSIILAAILVIVTVVVVYQIIQKNKSNQAADAALNEQVDNEEYGLSFSYKTGADGFALVEPPADQVGILKAYLLLPTEAYDEYKTREVPGEAPAGMNIFVFDLGPDQATTTQTASSAPRVDRMTRLQEWAITNNGITSFSEAKSPPETVEIDGLKMFRYKADGLYQQEVYLGSYKNRAYMFVGQYNEESDKTHTAFQTLIQSVSFD